MAWGASDLRITLNLAVFITAYVLINFGVFSKEWRQADTTLWLPHMSFAVAFEVIHRIHSRNKSGKLHITSSEYLELWALVLLGVLSNGVAFSLSVASLIEDTSSDDFRSRVALTGVALLTTMARLYEVMRIKDTKISTTLSRFTGTQFWASPGMVATAPHVGARVRKSAMFGETAAVGSSLHYGGDANEMAGPLGPTQDVRQPRHLHPRTRPMAKRIDFAIGRCEQQVHPLTLQRRAVLFQGTGITRQVLVLPELHGVHVDTCHDPRRQLARPVHQLQVPGMKIAHGGHQRNAFTV